MVKQAKIFSIKKERTGHLIPLTGSVYTFLNLTVKKKASQNDTTSWGGVASESLSVNRRKPPLFKGFYTKVRSGDTHPFTTPPRTAMLHGLI